MIASEFMTGNVHSLTQDRTVMDAAKLMLEKNISNIPIVDENFRLVGIITESDFIGKDAHIPHALASIKRVLGQIFYNNGVEDVFNKVKSLPLEKVMTRTPHTVSPDHTLSDVVYLMNSHHLKRIPVVKDHKLVGIITRHDIIRAFTLLSSTDGSRSTV